MIKMKKTDLKTKSPIMEEIKLEMRRADKKKSVVKFSFWFGDL